MSDEQAVLFANDAFYQAFADCDIAAMDAVWARESPVVCIHPGWEALAGRDEVMASWRGILGNPAPPRIRCLEPRVFAFGALAFVVCYEAIEGSVLVATNLFVREDDNIWRLVHHQAGPTNYRPKRGGTKPPEALH